MTDTAELIAVGRLNDPEGTWDGKPIQIALADALEASLLVGGKALEAAQAEIDTLRKELAWAAEVEAARERGVTL